MLYESTNVVPLFKTSTTLYKIHTYIYVHVYTMFEGANRKSLTFM